MLIQEKISQAKTLLEEFNVDCWITFVRETLIQSDPSLAFLAAGELTWHSAFIINRDGTSCAIVGKYDQASIEDLKTYDEVIGFVRSFQEPFTEYMRRKNPGRIAVNYSVGSEICDGLTHGMYLTLITLLAGIGMNDRVVSAEQLVSALRERKSPAELTLIRNTVRLTENIWERTARFLKPGLKEKEVAAFMQAEAAARHADLAWAPSTCPSVFSGPGGAEAHYAPGETALERGHVVNMDFGLKVDRYVSDMQRTFYILKEGESAPPDNVAHAFTTIVKSIEEAKRAMKPGIEGHQIDAVARSIVTEAGFEEFPHALGHQLGLYPHDGTALLGPPWEKYAEKPFRKLEPNMVFTLEPRAKVEQGIVTIEEMVAVTADGCEWISTPQKELILIRS